MHGWRNCFSNLNGGLVPVRCFNSARPGYTIACAHFDRKMLRYGRFGLGGQAMVEFALVMFVALIVLFVAIQMAFIGQAALALGQMNYQGARFAAVNQCATP